MISAAKRLLVAVAATITAVTLAGCSGVPAETIKPSLSHAQSQSAPFSPIVVTVGDSIMKGNGLTPAEAWPQLIAGALGWTNTNLACNGEGFVAVGDPADCNGPFGVLATRVALLKPTTLILSGSSNDFGIDNGILRDATVDALQRLRVALPAVQIVALSTVWSDTEPPEQLADVNAQVREATERVGGVFVDIGQPFAGHPELLQPDDVHPTAEGQQVLAAAISAALLAQHVEVTAQ